MFLRTLCNVFINISNNKIIDEFYDYSKVPNPKIKKKWLKIKIAMVYIFPLIK